MNTYYAIPLQVLRGDRLSFTRTTLQPGIVLTKFQGPESRKLQLSLGTGSFKLEISPTHLILVDQDKYFEGLDSKLNEPELRKSAPTIKYVDIPGLVRHVLVSIWLRGGLGWRTSGYFSKSGESRAYSYCFVPKAQVSERFNVQAPAGWHRYVSADQLRRVYAKLEPYYRADCWWVDRISVALGYLWSGMTSTHNDLSYVAFCMGLEALLSTSQSGISHELAERFALLTETDANKRQGAYKRIKKLYDTRSRIAHGDTMPRRGVITIESLAITAKRSYVPRGQFFDVSKAIIDLLIGAIHSKEFVSIMHTRQNDEKTNEAIKAFFESRIFS